MRIVRACGLACVSTLAAVGCVMVDEAPAGHEGAGEASVVEVLAGGAGGADRAAVQAVYVVGEGETLSAIAGRFAVPGGWRALAAANRLVDPDHVEAGQGLIVPTEGLIAAGYDPFSLYDEHELIPRHPPIELPPPPPVVFAEDEWQPDADTPDGCGGRHHHLAIQPELLADAEARHCVRLARATLCVGARYADDVDEPEDDEDTVEVTVDGTPWLSLPYSYLRPLEIVEVDLDGHGRDELLLSDLAGISNGAAIATYELVVAAAPDAAPHRYTTSGWSLAARTDGGCALAHQRFENIVDPVEGDGNYDVERELAWQDGVLHTRGEDVRAQRWSEVPPQLRREPLLEGQLLSRRTGTVVAFDDRRDGDRALTLDVGGDRVVLAERTWRWSDDEDDPDPDLQYVGLGWTGESVLLPDDYRPPAAALVGRDATIEARLDVRTGELTQLVWLEVLRL